MKLWGEIKQATLDKLFLTPEEADEQGYLKKITYLANECLNLIANGVKPRIATLEITTEQDNEEVEFPEDYITYGDFVNYYRRNDKCNWEKFTDVVFVDDRKIVLKKAGDYKIIYNAEWDKIPNDPNLTPDYEVNVDNSVLNCLPSYIAAELLGQDDMNRSITLKNDFELKLSRLDTNVMYENNSFKSNGGWY